ncbi:MAG: hypothetical protein WCZ90_13580 [Melioribacteraceae bacterium]
MVPFIRDQFNDKYSVARYKQYLNDIWKLTNGENDFRVCETPLFLDEELSSKLQFAAEEIVSFLLTDEFKKNSLGAIPEKLVVPSEDSHPLFLQVDFAICKDEEGKPIPKLIELQGFPSLYAFQVLLDDVNRQFYEIPNGYTSYFNDFLKESYLRLLKKAILANHDPKNVILLEIEPWKQKTRIDFILTKQYLGIDSICISEIIQRGKKLFYKKDGFEIPIHRIYNRVIFDELQRKDIKAGFDFHSELDVEWAGHPNWFFKISKHTLPLIRSSYAPNCFYLSDLKKYPPDLENYVLKPLYSFAGAGVQVDITKEILDSIVERKDYILQEKVEYMPLIKTPDEYSRAEIRMMFIWLDKEPILVNNLLRTSKGKMMGVDFNKGKTWVGSNIVYHP